MLAIAAAGAGLAASVALAQAPAAPTPPPGPPAGARQATAPGYGPFVTLDQAKRAAAGAEAEAKKRNVSISIAVSAPTGDIVYFEHMDGALYATDELAKLKAASSARYRWPTSFFATMKKNGQDFPNVFVGGGGMPLVVAGKTVGAIGVSGAFDDQIAQAGVDALK